MELLAIDEGLHLEDNNWPIWHAGTNRSPARISPVSGGLNASQSKVSMIASGCMVKGLVNHSVLGAGCIVAESATVESCILFDDVVIEPDAYVRNAIIKEGIRIPRGCKIGFDPQADKELGATITEAGRTIISISPSPA